MKEKERANRGKPFGEGFQLAATIHYPNITPLSARLELGTKFTPHLCHRYWTPHNSNDLVSRTSHPHKVDIQ